MKKTGMFLFEHYEEIILAPGMAVMLLINFANILGRYVFQVSWAATEEVCVICFVYISLIGAAVAVKRRMHLGFTLILEKLPPKARLVFDGLITAAVIGLMSLMIYYGYLVCANQVSHSSATPAMRIPLVYASASVPLSGLTIIIRSVQVYIEDIRKHILGQKAEGAEA